MHSPNGLQWACRCWRRFWVPKAAGPAIVTILVDMVITTLVHRAVTPGWHDGASAGRAVQNALRGGDQPHAWAIMGAPGVGPAIEFPSRWFKPWGCWPIRPRPALFTIGAVLAAHRSWRGQARRTPCIDGGAGGGGVKSRFAPAVGAADRCRCGSDRRSTVAFALTVLVLLAAAQRQQRLAAGRALYADNGRIARIILVSTAAAFYVAGAGFMT